MASKKLQVEKQQDDDHSAQEGSAMNSIIRYGLVAVLAFIFLKPYFLDKNKDDAIEYHNFAVHGQTMGTTWNALINTSVLKLIEINNDTTIADENTTIESGEVLLSRIIQRELDKVDAIASTYKSDSEISRFNASKSTDWFSVSAEAASIVEIAQKVSRNTNGAFDVTVAPLVNLYRFGPNKSPLTALPSDEQVLELKEHVGYDKLEVRLDPPALRKSDPSLTIDLSGVAKGFAVDQARKALESVGLTSYMIEVGGEICCRGHKVDADTGENKPWVLGIQTPEVVANDVSGSQRAPQMYRLLFFDSEEDGGALATSGDYRNFLQVGDTRFSHIVDPRTGKPTEIVQGEAEPTTRLGSVSVVSTSCADLSCAEADAYATAFFVLGSDEGASLAEKLNLAVLYLYRADDSARIDSLTEVATPAFTALGSKTLDELKSERSASSSADKK